MKIFNATTKDVEQMHQLIKIYADKGIVLPRSLSSIYQHLQCMYTVKDQGKVVGVAGLHVLGKDLAEIRSIVVDPEYQNNGIGSMLVNHIIMESSKLKVERLLSLTYEVDFFIKHGFSIVQKENFLEKIWIDCLSCPKFKQCDEIAMIKYLAE